MTALTILPEQDDLIVFDSKPHWCFVFNIHSFAIAATSATKHGAHINDTVVTRDVTGPILLENYGLLKRFVDIWQDWTFDRKSESTF